jgi:hypothetical protein
LIGAGTCLSFKLTPGVPRGIVDSLKKSSVILSKTYRIAVLLAYIDGKTRVEKQPEPSGPGFLNRN